MHARKNRHGGSSAANPDAVDVLFDQLSHRLRRHVLRELLRTDGDRSTRDLASGTDRPEQTRSALYHVHLPKLADADFVEWDQDAGTVAPGPRLDATGPVVELLIRADDRDVV